MIVPRVYMFYFGIFLKCIIVKYLSFHYLWKTHSIFVVSRLLMNTEVCLSTIGLICYSSNWSWLPFEICWRRGDFYLCYMMGCWILNTEWWFVVVFSFWENTRSSIRCFNLFSDGKKWTIVRLQSSVFLWIWFTRFYLYFGLGNIFLLLSFF